MEEVNECKVQKRHDEPNQNLSVKRALHLQYKELY